jgi:hypothetical protein
MLLGCSLLAPRIPTPSFPTSGPRAGPPRLAGLPAQAAAAGTLARPTLSPPRDPQAGDRRSPAAERRGVPRRLGIRYRRRKGWKGYRDSTDFNLDCGVDRRPLKM